MVTEGEEGARLYGGAPSDLDAGARLDGFSHGEVEAFEIELPHHEPTAEWYHAAFHTVCAVVGAGVLGLPYALSYLGWAAGLLTLSALIATSFYTSYLLAALHHGPLHPPSGSAAGGSGAPTATAAGRKERRNTYRALGAAVWGARAGAWAVAPFQYSLMVGLCVTYSVTAGQSLKGAASSSCAGEDCAAGLAPWIAGFGAAQLGLSQVRDFAALWWVSAAGGAMSVAYCTIAAAASAAHIASDGAATEMARQGETRAEHAFGVLNALGALAFAFGGQAVLPEIQATLAVPPGEASTLRPMMKALAASYAVVVALYYSVAAAGYAAYGGAVAPDVLLSVREPGALVAAANVAVALHVAAGYQVFAQPIFAAAEAAVARRAAAAGRPPPRPAAARAAVRGAFVAATTLAACALPFFGDLMGIVASLGLMPVTFILPPLLWLGARGRALRRGEAALCAAIAAAATALAAAALVGSTRNIVVDSEAYASGLVGGG